VREQHGFLSLPLMVRPSSVIPMGSVDTRPDYHYPDGVTFHVFELGDGAEVETRVPDMKGRTALVLRTQREDERITFRAEGDTRNWKIVLHSVRRVRDVKGGQAESTTEEVTIQPEGGADTVVVII